MMIIKERCLELGLPEPKSYDTQQGYIVRAMREGHTMDTRQCRYIGIGNLHSIVSQMRNKGYHFFLDHRRRYCPALQKIMPYCVDVIWMTKEQRASYQKEKPTKA